VFLYCAQKDLEHRQTVGFHRLMARCGTLKAAIFKGSVPSVVEIV